MMISTTHSQLLPCNSKKLLMVATSKHRRSYNNYSLGNYLRKRSCGRRCYVVLAAAGLMKNPDYFEVGRLIGSYGYMNITSYSSSQSRYFSAGQSVEANNESQSDADRLRLQDAQEGPVSIRLYDGRVVQGPERGTRVIFKVYPGKLGGGVEADLMASNELGAYSYLQDVSDNPCQNLQILLGAFETTTGEQWLAFRKDGKYTAAVYAKSASDAYPASGWILWNAFELDETIKRRRLFVIKLLRGAINGLDFMHGCDRLHQSVGPASVVLNTVVEKDVAYLVPRLRDLAFSVDIGYSSMESRSSELSESLWRRATAAGAFSYMQKRAFGIADDIFEAGLLVAYLAFVPFSEAGLMDWLSLQKLFESTFDLNVAAAREYFQADERLSEAVKFLDLGDSAGWELLQAMLNPDYRQRPTAAAVLNHRFMTGACL